MSAFNIVRFKVKPGRKDEFIEAHKKVAADWPGLKHANLVQTGERGFYLVGEWDSKEALEEARPKMIETLNGFRDCLEALGPKGGVTAAVSGDVVLEMK